MDLSIIIPAYNCIDTIDLTLDSIARQKISMDYEVVLVNDCSDYDYLKFIKKYNDKMNIREIRTDKNVGPGCARQLGIDNTFSKYIIFIDSDDCFYDEYSISKMYNEINNNDYDVVICNFFCERDTKSYVRQGDLIWLHGKIYRRKFINDNKIKFNNTRSNEDNGFNRLIFLMDPKVSFLDEVVYIYKKNPNSITRINNGKFKFEGIEGFCYNMNWAMEEALNRGQDLYKIARVSLDTLLTLYVYYHLLKKEYDVRKIIDWAEKIYMKYSDNRKLLDDKLVMELVHKKKFLMEELVKFSEYDMDFEQFLDLFENNLSKY